MFFLQILLKDLRAAYWQTKVAAIARASAQQEKKSKMENGLVPLDWYII